MRANRHTLALLAAATAGIAVAACGRPDRACNTDLDCDAEVCILGTCTERDRGDLSRRQAGTVGGDLLDVPGDGFHGNGGAGGGNGNGGNGGSGGGVVAEPPPGGCDPASYVRIYPDDDGDGYTGAPRFACPDALPAGASSSPIVAPVLLVEPDTVAPTFGAWDADNVLTAQPSAPSGAIGFGGFACGKAPTSLEGLSAAVAVWPETVPVLLDVALTVEEGGRRGVTVVHRVQIDSVDGAAVIFDDPGSLWGLHLSTSDVCDPSLTLDVELTVLAGPSLDPVRLQTAPFVVAAFGEEDCDDDDRTVFSPGDLRIDRDGDGVGSGSPARACTGLTVPPGAGVRDADCAPDDAFAFPGQHRGQDVPRAGVGGFDYDCNGVEEHILLTSAAGCTSDANGCHPTGETVVDAACGALANVGTCDAACQLQVVATPQTCR